MKRRKTSGFVGSGAIGAIDVIQITFVILKLLNIIDWNWVYVLLPWIIQLALVSIILIFAAIYDKVCR